MFKGLTCFSGRNVKAVGILAGIRTATFRPCFPNDSEQSLTWRCSQWSKIYSDSPALTTDTCQCRIIFSLHTKGYPARYLLIDNEYLQFPFLLLNTLYYLAKKGRISDILCETLLLLLLGNLPYQPVLCISFCSFSSLVPVLATVKTSLRCHWDLLSVRQNGLKFVYWILEIILLQSIVIICGRKKLCMGSNDTYWSHCCIILLYKPKLDTVQTKRSVKQVLVSPLKDCSLPSVTFNTLLRPGEVPAIVCFYINLIPREQ